MGPHAASEFYGVERFLSGESTLLPVDLEEVGGASFVAGKSLLHLQCHFGLDTLSWARLGARATGVDFARSAVALARDLASRSGLSGSARFVEAELYESPSVVSGRFDVVYVNVGALCWLPDIRGWARVCAGFLERGGVLYVRDVHPLLWALDDEEPSGRHVLRYPYFETVAPLRWDDGGDYASDATLTHAESYEWNHSLGEIASAVLEAGLQIELLREHDWTVYRALPWLEESEPGVWRMPGDRLSAPLQFSLRARKG